MKKALKQLLNALDRLADDGHDEVRDTDVSEQMFDAVHKTLVEPLPGYELPEEFGMFSAEGNAGVRAILADFLAHPEFPAAKALATPKERLNAFQDIEVESRDGNTHDEYFGYSDDYE